MRSRRLLPVETEEYGKLLDSEKYKAALLEFLRLIDGLNQPKALIAEYLRYPAFDYSTLSGSSLGRDIWEKPPAQKLISTLLEDDELRKWFNPPPGSSLTELRAQIASLVAAWDLHPVPAEKIVEEWADPLLQAMKNPAPACSRIGVLYGVEVADRIDLPGGVAIEQASTETLREWLAGAHALERDALRIPRSPAILVSASLQVRRDEIGCFAAITANGFTEVLAENARWNIWLVTGVLPRLGDAYVSEYSQFPATPYERNPASYRETHTQGATRQSALVDAGLLLQVHERMAVLHGEHETFPEEAMMPLWVANTFIHPAIDQADALMTVLLAYAAAEGLLLRKEDDDSRLGPRLAILVGRDNDEEKRLRRVAARWAELRGFAAHGQRPPIENVATFLEQQVPTDHLSSESLLGVETIRKGARDRAGKLLRRAFLAMLFCSVTMIDGSPQPSFTRDQILETLELAASGDEAARREIAAKVPQFVRDIGL